ncbi:MAG: HEAT repeat domain-containing protein [Deltaproteobacteria bacterium]|jgi:HEAT repeat protein|nr:HEAT repeat domain-containing protein [Deltaproteobacteria bacterium]
MRRIALALLLGLWATPVWAKAPDEIDRLLGIIAQDSSYKVRMQAIRVLSRRLEQNTTPVSDGVLNSLATAATKDESHLVRGFACVALGNLQDPRARPALTAAARDPEELVRQQANMALSRLPATPPPPPPPPSGGPARLVVAVDVTPGVEAQALEGPFLTMLTEGFRGAAAERFVVGPAADGRGFHLKGSIAELSSVAQADGSQRVTIVVKVAIATWPENNLRHVMSAKASAMTKASGGALARVQEKLLKAAVERAVKDSMAEIGGG